MTAEPVLYIIEMLDRCTEPPARYNPSNRFSLNCWEEESLRRPIVAACRPQWRRPFCVAFTGEQNRLTAAANGSADSR